MAVLDTSLLVDLLRSEKDPFHQRAATKIADLRAAGQVLTTTRVNAAELYVGVELSDNRADEQRRVDVLLGQLTVLELDDMAARRFGMLAAHLQKRGRPSGDLDVLIAAIAMVSGQLVVTRNPKHFSEIPGITAETY